MPEFNNPTDPRAMEAVARQVWGAPNASQSSRDEMRFGRCGSKSIKPFLGIWFDHEAGEGGHYRDLYRIANGAYPENGSDKSGFQVPGGMLRQLGNPVAWWDYHDERGSVSGRVVRFEPAGQGKTFRQCRPDGAGWAWKMDGAHLPLYRLPGLLHAPAGSLVYLTEGEKHADQLRQWGLIATTNAGGAGKFRPDHARALARHTVIVLSDNDEPGRKHVEACLRELRKAGVTAHALPLPGLPPKGDVLDWIAAGGTAVELQQLTASLLASSSATTQEHAEDTSANEHGPDWLAKRLSAATLMRRTFPAETRYLGSIITQTSRVFLVGSTGTGKTMFGLALAAGIASGSGFLHWRSCRAARVLYIDGEMPLRTLRARVCDATRRVGLSADEADALPLSLVSWQDAGDLGLGPWMPFNTEDGQRFVVQLCDALKPDVVIFDNVQALLSGDMKDEVPWNDTWPLISLLTGREIGQVWLDHTGHDTSRQYGTSTKAWRFDTVGIMTALPIEERARTETAFTLSFETPGKARNRSPETWNEYETTTIRLHEDAWTSQAVGGEAGQTKLRPSRMPFYEALTSAIARGGAKPGETTRQAWEAECVRAGLIEPPGTTADAARRAPLRRAQSDMITSRWVLVDGERMVDMRHRWT